MPFRPLVLACACFAFSVAASEPPPGFTGKAELGYLATSGNTETSSLNAKLTMGFEALRWRHGLTAAVVKAEDSGATTAERYQFGAKSDYKFNEFDYLFVTVNWEQDEFAGFSQRTSEAIGYGRRLLASDLHRLEVELGAGARQTDLVLGPSLDESIVRAAAKYRWSFAANAGFDQALVVEQGDENRYLESVSALTAQLTGSLNLKLSYTIKSNSEVAPGLERTDTYTAIAIEYGF